jgi:hypothetical protein
MVQSGAADNVPVLKNNQQRYGMYLGKKAPSSKAASLQKMIKQSAARKMQNTDKFGGQTASDLPFNILQLRRPVAMRWSACLVTSSAEGV